ncbi:enoyl-CoA hydratase [Dinoroseobacter sp. S76]|uniref:enoyl-CoA hydratase n=1 Tax=Dinoroseobacter sp. S76 TaxID=3415124 RepID=UPI003C7ACCBD
MSETSHADGKLLLSEADGIATIRFNAPDRRNAMTFAMWQALGDVALALPETTRVVILTGTGDKAFVSGADISEFATLRSTPEQVARYNAQVHRALSAVAALPMPVIAQIQGYCIGGGLEIATRCDMRLASETARFAFTPAKLGLAVAADEVAALARLIGPAATSDLLFTARQVPAEDALRWGLIDRRVPAAALAETVAEVAQQIAANAPLTLRAVKAALRAGPNPDAASRAAVEAQVAACFASADYAEGQAAFAEKRRPIFQGK